MISNNSEDLILLFLLQGIIERKKKKIPGNHYNRQKLKQRQHLKGKDHRDNDQLERFGPRIPFSIHYLLVHNSDPGMAAMPTEVTCMK